MLEKASQILGRLWISSRAHEPRDYRSFSLDRVPAVTHVLKAAIQETRGVRPVPRISRMDRDEGSINANEKGKMVSGRVCRRLAFKQIGQAVTTRYGLRYLARELPEFSVSDQSRDPTLTPKHVSGSQIVCGGE